MGCRTAVLAAAVAAVLGPASAAAEASGAAVLMYHRFGDERHPSTNIRLEQFDAHLAELKRGGYTVLGLPEIVAAFAAGRALPDRTVAITIDDAYASVYAEAWPRLRRAGLPFTLFVATDPVDAGQPDMMTWDQLRELAAAGVAIGNHTDSHLHLPGQAEDDAAAAIARAQKRLTDELGAAPTLFAYPYGEYDLGAVAAARAAGFVAAFGQHSGVAHAGAPRHTLSRFALNEAYGRLDRFRVVASALALPTADVTPADPVLTTANNPPSFGFTVAADVEGLDRLACFASSGTAQVERLGERRFEVRLAHAFPSGRARINCTVPVPPDRFRWFGVQFVAP